MCGLRGDGRGVGVADETEGAIAEAVGAGVGDGYATHSRQRSEFDEQLAVSSVNTAWSVIGKLQKHRGYLVHDACIRTVGPQCGIRTEFTRSRFIRVAV